MGNMWGMQHVGITCGMHHVGIVGNNHCRTYSQGTASKYDAGSSLLFLSIALGFSIHNCR